MKQFEVGKTYSMRSIGDYDCIWTYKVTARTAQMITLVDDLGKVTKCRINKQATEYFKHECVKPLGSYSMAPILRAAQ